MVRSRPFDPSSRVFDEVAAGIDGRRMSGFDSETIEELEKKHARNAALRRELLAVFGSERKLELALSQASGEPASITAERLQIDRSSVLRQRPKALCDGRVGILAVLISRLLELGGAATLDPKSGDTVASCATKYAVVLQSGSQQFRRIPSHTEVVDWLETRWKGLVESYAWAGKTLPLYIGVSSNESAGTRELARTVVVDDINCAMDIAVANDQPTILSFSRWRPVEVKSIRR